MSIDLLSDSAPAVEDAQALWSARTDAAAALAAPLGVIDLDDLRYNALDLTARSGGLPIRVASGSVRVRSIIEAVLALPGFGGVLADTLPEALWLCDTVDDIVMAYPTADRAALAVLCRDERAAARITLLVDDPRQLDLIDAVCAPDTRAPVRVAMAVDPAWRSAGLGRVGARRSSLGDPVDVSRLALHVAGRAGFTLVGMMMDETPLPVHADAVAADAAIVRWAQRRSRIEQGERRAALVAAVREVADLEFVGACAPGSLEAIAQDEAVTETTTGGALLTGHLVDRSRSFPPAPAAAFALEVVRTPAPDIVTVLGGGWAASGHPVRWGHSGHTVAVGSSPLPLPLPVWPPELRLLARHAGGHLQTPLRGRGARGLRVGDRVWFRHADSGELAEHLDTFHLLRGAQIVGEVMTYRGEGRRFL